VTRGRGPIERLEAFCAARAPLVLAVMMAAWATVFSYHAWLKYCYYLYSDIDLAIFVQAVAGILRGSCFNSIRGMNWLGDHSSLILFMVAPVYALFRHPLTLPVLQCVALALGAIPVWSLARRELGGALVPLGFAALYLLYPAVGYTALYEFHPEVLCTASLLATIACYRAESFGLTLVFAGVSLLGKEDVALPVAALALLELFQRRSRYAAGLGGLALASLVLSFVVLKPALSHGEVDYARIYARWGETPSGVALGLLSHPFKALGAMFFGAGSDVQPTLDVQYYAHMLGPFLLLPLASPLTLLLALPTFATHFLSWRPAQHTIYYQYTALVTPFVVAAAVIGLRNLLSRRRGAAPPTGRLKAEAKSASLGETGAARWAMLAMFAASLGANWMFGPLTGHGRMQAVVAEEAVAPTGRDRALARERDRMMRELGARDSVVAGFEFLSRLAARRNVRSLHNTLGGFHTFSGLRYPVPEDVTALIADVSGPRIRPFADLGTSARLHELLERNRLGLVDAAGDNLLFLRDAPDSVSLWSQGERPVPAPHRVTFDGQLAYLGDELMATTVAPGGRLPLRTFWRKAAPTESLYVLQFTAFDAAGKSAFATMRYLGYMLHPAGDWPDTTMVYETYRMIVPDDAAPGTYMLGMRVGRRDQLDQVLCEPDDPQVRAQSNVVELGRFTMAAGARAYR